jgi:beta-glucosidase
MSVAITNTGTRSGAEVLQLFIHPPPLLPTSRLRIRRPIREPQGFESFLHPGEQKEAKCQLDRHSVLCWDEKRGNWVSQEGIYTGEIVAGPHDVSESFEVEKTTWRGWV